MRLMTARNALGAFSFARLNGLMGAKRADDDKPEDKAEDKPAEHYDDDGKDGKQGRRAEGKDDGDEDDDKDGDDKNATRAENDDDDDDKDARRAEDDDDDQEMKRAKAAGFGSLLANVRRGGYAAGRQVERARCGRILSSNLAAARIGSALHLACNTGMSSKQAVALLGTLPEAKAAGGALDRAMSRVTQPAPGGEGGGPSSLTPGQSLLAGAKVMAKGIEERRQKQR